MKYEEDFVNEESVEFEIEGKKFSYKPTTAGDENSWMDEYMEIKDGKSKQNLNKINECKIRNIVGVPYSKELIKKQIGIEKEWNQLNNDEKWKLFSKLSPNFFNNIILKINKIDSKDDSIKKN